MDIVRFDYEETVNKVMSKHKRKLSQLQSLESELGLYFDETEATRIAKETMMELNPIKQSNESDPSAFPSVSVEAIVANARKQHKRKVSQFQAIKHDIRQYIPDETEASRLASEVMKEFNPNQRSGKATQVSVDSIVEQALVDHKRKKSQFKAIENDLGLIFDKEDVEQIAKDAMKKVFANKQGQGSHTNDIMQHAHT
eukprot:3571_1